MSASRAGSDPFASGRGPVGIAARAGVWSAKHRKTAIWGWLAFVVIAFMIGGAVGTKTLEHTQTGVGESGRADQAISDAAPGARPRNGAHTGHGRDSEPSPRSGP